MYESLPSCKPFCQVQAVTAPQALRAIAVPVLLRENVIRPILAGIAQPKMTRRPKNWSPIDTHYEDIRQNMFTLFEDLAIAA
jgi:hypothetical protein